jgi:hypothetical protein
VVDSDETADADEFAADDELDATADPMPVVVGTDGPFYDPYPPHMHNYRTVTGGLYGMPYGGTGGWMVLNVNGTKLRGRARIGRGGRLIIDRMNV